MAEVLPALLLIARFLEGVWEEAPRMFELMAMPLQTELL